MKELEAYIDGACKGNPGPCGVGVIVCQAGRVIKNISAFIGNGTNNMAEYTALIYALQEGLILKADKMKINTDSQLLACQINKTYKVKDAKIKALYNQAAHLMSAFDKVTVNHIPRADNAGADKLADKAVKESLRNK